MSLAKARARTRRLSPLEPVHARHSSEVQSPRGKYQQDIQSLNDTLSSLTSIYKTRDSSPAAQKPQIEVQSDAMHQRLLGRMSVDSSLRVEVELIHKISQSLRSSVDSGLTLPALSASPTPYAKQIPSSTYASYKNALSFDSLTYRQEIYAMIGKVSASLFPKEPTKIQKLEKELTQAYEKSLQMDTRLTTSIWSECLLSLSSVSSIRKGITTNTNSKDADLITIEQELDSLLSDYISGAAGKQTESVVASISKLSQHFRILIKKMQGEQMVLVSELIWKTNMLLFDELLSVCKREIAGNYAEVERQAKREEGRIAAHLRLLTEQWQAKLEECFQENSRLRHHESRLKQEIEHYMELVSERDEELKQLHDSGAFIELEKMLAEFVANAGDDPGMPILPKSLYGSGPVSGVKMNPTRFGAGKPEPVAVESVKEPPSVELPKPQIVEQPRIETRMESESSEESVEIPPLPVTKPQEYPDSDPNPSPSEPQNIILRQIQRYPQPTHIFRVKDVYKLFEALMDAKFQFDVFAESQTVPFEPRSLAQFTLDYLYQKHGKRSETLKHVASLVKTLEKMRTEGDKYADLFYCLIGLSEFGEFDLDLDLFLVKSRMAFQEQLLRSKGKAAKADKEVGGKLTFAEASDLIYSLFKEKREVGEAVLARITLPDVDDIEKAKLVFCGKLGKIGRDLKYFFVQADLQKTGSVNFQVFAKTCRTSLEMNLSLSNLQLLWSSLTTAETLTYPQLTTMDFKALSARAYSKPLAISKLVLLNCIIAQYFTMKESDEGKLKNLFQQFDANEDGVLTLSEFTDLVTTLEPSCPPSKVVQVFRSAVESRDSSNPDSMSPSSFCQVALHYRLGGFGNSVFQSRLTHLFSKASEDSPQSAKKKGRKKQ